ncbi:MAG: hypothetical protein EOM14_05180 [Clostridia bacterium]|nr:hypothetical protein [Clostridia bacterium]
MIRYYLTQRPPAPGTFPGRPVNLKSFDSREYVEEIGRPAWGWVEYEWPLTIKETEDYELTRPIAFNIKDAKTNETLATIREKEAADGMLVYMKKKYPEKKLRIEAPPKEEERA